MVDQIQAIPAQISRRRIQAEIQDPRDHCAFEFDVNVIFTTDDKEWATEQLRRNIKEQLPHFDRIAFGDDDLPLGKYFLDAVLYVIEHSFKTVLLLSRAATQDHEFMMKAAHCFEPRDKHPNAVYFASLSGGHTGRRNASPGQTLSE